MAVGLELKIARIKAGLLQLEVARLSGLGNTRISKIERGWIEPTPEETERLRAAIARANSKELDEQRATSA